MSLFIEVPVVTGIGLHLGEARKRGDVFRVSQNWHEKAGWSLGGEG